MFKCIFSQRPHKKGWCDNELMPHGDADWISRQYPERLRPGLVHDSPQSCPAKCTIFRDKILNDQIKMKRPVAPTISSIKLILYFSISTFQKTETCPSRLAHAGKGSWEIARMCSAFDDNYSVSCQIVAYNFQLRPRDVICLSSRERGWDYSNSSFIKNVDERRVSRLSFLWICFLGYFMTGLCA